MTNLIPTESELKAIEVMAKNACESKFFNNLNGYGGIFSIAMFARELGLPVMQCLFGGMTNIQGKIEIAPRMMNAMIRKAGHQIQIVKSDDEICILKGIRSDTGEIYDCTYSLSDAGKAGLSSKSNWKNYASDMLFARCMSRLARRLFADVIGTAYVQGEIDDERNERSARSSDPIDISLAEEKSVNTKEELIESVPITEQQKERLNFLVEKINDPSYCALVEDWCKSQYKVNSVYEINQDQYNLIVKRIENKLKQIEASNESSSVA